MIDYDKLYKIITALYETKVITLEEFKALCDNKEVIARVIDRYNFQ